MVNRISSGQGIREATAYGALLHEDDTHTRSVRADLRPKDVDTATRAWGHGLEVAVKGGLTPPG